MNRVLLWGFIFLSWMVWNSFSFSRSQRHVLKQLPFRTRWKLHTATSISSESNQIEEENLLLQADKILGTKSLFQQISQLLYKKYPLLTWDDHQSSLTITFGNVKYISTLDHDGNKQITNAIKKQFEITAIRKLLFYLYESSSHRTVITAYLFEKLNKANTAKIFSRDEALQLASERLLVVLVDTENIGDFRKVFYIDKLGEIRFSSKQLPSITVAPPLSTDSIEENGKLIEDRLWFEREEVNYQDKDILILSYAQAENTLNARANRLSLARGRDAADYLMLYDLGAIQRLTNLRGIFLITGDRFGASVKECVNEDVGKRFYPYPALTLFPECKAAAKAIGRLY